MPPNIPPDDEEREEELEDIDSESGRTNVGQFAGEHRFTRVIPIPDGDYVDLGESADSVDLSSLDGLGSNSTDPTPQDDEGVTSVIENARALLEYRMPLTFDRLPGAHNTLKRVGAIANLRFPPEHHEVIEAYLRRSLQASTDVIRSPHRGEIMLIAAREDGGPFLANVLKFLCTKAEEKKIPLNPLLAVGKINITSSEAHAGQKVIIQSPLFAEVTSTTPPAGRAGVVISRSQLDAIQGYRGITVRDSAELGEGWQLLTDFDRPTDYFAEHVSRDLVDREVEIALFDDAFNQSYENLRRVRANPDLHQNGTVKALLVKGEAGVGKTSFGRECILRARDSARTSGKFFLDCEVKAFPEESSRKLLYVRKLARQIIEKLEEEGVDVAPEFKGLMLFAGMEVSTMTGSDVAKQKQLELSKVALAAELRKILKYSALHLPLLGLDDPQWMDAASEEVLAHFINQSDHHDVLVLKLTARSVPRMIQKALEAKSEDGGVEMVDLSLEPLKLITDDGAVDREKVRRCVARAFPGARADELPDTFLDQIANMSQGSPLVLNEILHTLRRNKKIKIKNGKVEVHTTHLEIGNTADAILEGRFDNLQPDQEKACRALVACHGSINGKLFSRLIPEAVTRGSLQVLAHMGLVAEENGILQFKHDRLYDAAKKRFPPEHDFQMIDDMYAQAIHLKSKNPTIDDAFLFRILSPYLKGTVHDTASKKDVFTRLLDHAKNAIAQLAKQRRPAEIISIIQALDERLKNEMRMSDSFGTSVGDLIDDATRHIFDKEVAKAYLVTAQYAPAGQKIHDALGFFPTSLEEFESIPELLAAIEVHFVDAEVAYRRVNTEGTQVFATAFKKLQEIVGALEHFEPHHPNLNPYRARLHLFEGRAKYFEANDPTLASQRDSLFAQGLGIFREIIVRSERTFGKDLEKMSPEARAQVIEAKRMIGLMLINKEQQNRQKYDLNTLWADHGDLPPSHEVRDGVSALEQAVAALREYSDELLQDPKPLSSALLSLARGLCYLGAQQREVGELFDDALRVASGALEEYARILRLKADYLLAQGQTAHALRLYEQSLGELQQAGVESGEKKGVFGSVPTLRDAGDIGANALNAEARALFPFNAIPFQEVEQSIRAQISLAREHLRQRTIMRTGREQLSSAEAGALYNPWELAKQPHDENYSQKDLTHAWRSYEVAVRRFTADGKSNAFLLQYLIPQTGYLVRMTGSQHLSDPQLQLLNIVMFHDGIDEESITKMKLELDRKILEINRNPNLGEVALELIRKRIGLDYAAKYLRGEI